MSLGRRSSTRQYSGERTHVSRDQGCLADALFTEEDEFVFLHLMPIFSDPQPSRTSDNQMAGFVGFLVLYLTWGLTGFDEEKSCAAGFDMMLRASRLSCWEGVDDWWLSSYCNNRTTRLSANLGR